jgi:hypothetical protein
MSLVIAANTKDSLVEHSLSWSLLTLRFWPNFAKVRSAAQHLGKTSKPRRESLGSFLCPDLCGFLWSQFRRTMHGLHPKA